MEANSKPFERTEAQIVAMSPITVRLGESDYEIKPLRITAAQKWREKLIQEVGAISGVLKQDASTSPAFINGLAFVFLQFPEKMLDLLFAYAPYLPQEAIRDEEKGATEEQVSRAFGQIVQIAFPFVGELRAITQILSVAASSFPPSGKSTRPH